jgi:hypothetical protein
MHKKNYPFNKGGFLILKLLLTYLNFKLFIMKRKLNLIIAAWFVAVVGVAMVVTSCGSSHVACDAYGANSISNPDNAEFVNEIAFNEGIPTSSVTQAQFNARYK